MKLLNITLKNFRQFKDETTIEFSTSEKSNITLILGDNTSGKTTLLQAFLWCLYEEANFKSKDLINTETAFEMVSSRKGNSVEVSIDIQYGNRVYYIKRTKYHEVKRTEIIPSNISLVELSYRDNDTGQTRKVEPYLVQKTISEILPKDLSSYFFYDTERFGNITTKSDVTEAVKGLLGLTVLENAMKHLGKETQSKSVLGRYKAKLNLEGNKLATQALSKMQAAETEIESLTNRQQSVKKEIEHMRIQQEKIEAKIRSLENAAKDQREREKKENQLKLELRNLNSAEDLFKSNFKSNSFQFLAKPLIEEALGIMEEVEVIDKGLQHINAKAIKSIIERGSCICGNPIEEGNEAFENILNELKYLPPQSIGTIINNFKQQGKWMADGSNNYYESLEKSYSMIIKSRDMIADIEEEISVLAERIKEHESVRKYEEDREKIISQISRNEQLGDQLIKSIGENQRIIKDQEAIYKENVGVNERNRRILTYMAYANELLNWIEGRYEQREGEIKRDLEEKVNYYFKRMYHGNRRVEIDSNYRVKLITVSNDKFELQTDESQGLETVKNFSFIAGLVDLAREKLTSENNDQLEKENEDYPLVLDAPFSNADEKHVENISMILPEVASQLILIVMSKDWNHAEKALGARVGKKYHLIKESEVLTRVQEV